MNATRLRQGDPSAIARRLPWIDELRAIAILVMVVDHALLFFLPDNAVASQFRGTVTRCAEPLFVFAIVSVVARLNRRMRFGRWLQIVLVSVATSSLLSKVLGYPIADVLVSIAVTAPMIPMLLKLSKRSCIGALYVTATVSVLPMTVGGIVFDYSPILIVYQMLLSRLLLEGRGFDHGVYSAAVVLVASCVGLALGFPLSGSFAVVCFGHPIAALAVTGMRRSPSGISSSRAALLGGCPLRVYAGHLAAFGFLSWLMARLV